MNRLSLSLVICTYQRPHQVESLLISIKGQSLIPDEILIIDGSIDNKTQKAINNFQADNIPIRYVYIQPDQRGLTRQRNVGISLAHGEIIAFLDDDTIPNPEYFAHILSCFDRHPDAVGVGGLITTDLDWRPSNSNKKPSINVYRWKNWERPDGIRWRLRKILGLASSLPPGWMPPFGHGRPANYPPDQKDYLVEYVMGGSSAWRIDLFNSCLFSTYFQNYGLYEDLDFCIRAAKIGKIYLCTSAQLEHHHAPSGRPNVFNFGQMVVRNGWYVWRQRWPDPSLINRMKWWLITFLLAILRLPDFRGQGFKEALGRFSGCLSVLFNPPHEGSY